jgi:hypothetical protein
MATLVGNIKGPAGPAGPGLAVGGDPGQIAVKNSSTDFDTRWADHVYRHYQTAAATRWTITHNLGFRPSVTVEDSAGSDIIPGEITHVDNNTLQLDFSAAVGGEAYLS